MNRKYVSKYNSGAIYEKIITLNWFEFGQIQLMWSENMIFCFYSIHL